VQSRYTRSFEVCDLAADVTLVADQAFDTGGRMFMRPPSGTQIELYLSAVHLIDLRHWGSK